MNPTRSSGADDLPDLRSDPSISWPLVLLVLVMMGLVLWQFASILKPEEDFPTDHIDMAIRGDDIIVYNPTNELVSVFQVSVLRLTGTYTYTDRNLRPKSTRRVRLRNLRKADGTKYDPSQEGECRMRLEYWLGEDKETISRYCRGF